MSYHGYVGLVRNYIESIPKEMQVNVIEVGLDKGITFVALAAHLVYRRPRFQLVGIDVTVRDHVMLTVETLPPRGEDQRIVVAEQNSLEALPDMVGRGFAFDVFLLDGDHNYHTVSKELECMAELTHPNSLVIVDDYDGRWSEADQWYCEVPGYETTRATPKVDTEKHGVKAAVDDFLAKRPEWKLTKPMHGEPVLLTRELRLVP